MAKQKDEQSIELENGSEIILTGKDTEVITAGEFHNLDNVEDEILIKELSTRKYLSKKILDIIKPEEILKFISTKEGFFGDIDIIQIKLKKIDDSLSEFGYGENAKAEIMKKLIDKFLI